MSGGEVSIGRREQLRVQEGAHEGVPQHARERCLHAGGIYLVMPVLSYGFAKLVAFPESSNLLSFLEAADSPSPLL